MKIHFLPNYAVIILTDGDKTLYLPPKANDIPGEPATTTTKNSLC